MGSIQTSKYSSQNFYDADSTPKALAKAETQMFQNPKPKINTQSQKAKIAKHKKVF